MSIKYTPRAVRDLRSIEHYLQVQSPQGVRSVFGAIDDAMKMLSHFPECGVRDERGVRHIVEPRYGYLIYYRLFSRAPEIRILAVRHPARLRRS